jgi:fructose-specific component phosphotransferase system IIB-like protein
MTFDVILLALAASGCTAMASVAQRRAAAPAPGEFSFNLHLVGYLLRRPVWFLGILCMILGFVFQVAALRVGSLSVVQPVIATELVIVFGVIALHDPHRVHLRDWISAVGMVVGLGAFLALARPHGGRAEASMSMWALSGSVTFALAGILAALAYLPGRHEQGQGTGRKAALLGIAAAVGFGFVAAVVKELSTHLAQGPTAVFLNWSPYVLLLSGAAAMFLASNAFQAGSLAASQPGLTIVDPLVAGALGVVLFGESLRHNPVVLLGEVLAVAVVIASVIMLSQSPLVQDEGPSEVTSARTAPAVKTTGDRVRSARLPDALRRRMSSLDKGKGSEPVRTVTGVPENEARRPGAGIGAGEAVAPPRRRKKLVNQL